MANEYRLPYTGAEITHRLAKIDLMPTKDYVDSAISAIQAPDVSGQINEHNISNSAHNDIRLLVDGLTTRLNALADSDDDTLDQMSEVVTYIKSNKDLIGQITNNKVNVSDIINNLDTNVDNKPLSAAQGVALKALIDAIAIPTKVSELDNDEGYLTSFTETDPTVPAWAKAENKPTYTYEEVGADQSGSAANALIEAKGYTDSQIAAIPTPDVSGQIHTHNTATDAHNDIRLFIDNLTTRVNTLHDVDDETLDQMSEVVAYIKSNKSLIESVTTSKVNVTDIIDNLTTNVANQPLAASQGVAIQTLINALQEEVNKKALASDLTSHTSNKSNPHGVTAAQVGADASGSAATALTNAKSYIDGKVTELNAAISGKANASDLTSHVGNMNNPHGVTVAQIGLTAESWTFTLDDGSTVTKAVYIG